MLIDWAKNTELLAPTDTPFLIFVIPIREELWSALVKDKYHCITIRLRAGAHSITDLVIRT